jgi:vacuolar-type H+-ATPase subunit H
MHNAIASKVHHVDQLIAQTQELAHKVWMQHEQHIKQAETKQRKVFDNMLERAKLQGLALMEKKYQDKIKQVNKLMGNTHRITCQNTAHEYEKRLTTSYDKHRASMNKQITYMNDLAESLVEQVPMSVTSEIEVVKEDAIAELQTAIQNTKNKAIAQWDIMTATQDMLHGLKSKINNTMDKIIDKRKREFQRIQQDMENLIKSRCTEFKSHVEVFIKNEIGKHEDSALHHTLTIALTEAAEQMSKIKENAKKAVDGYIAMRKQELEYEMGEINCNTSYDNKRNEPNDNNRQEHDYTPSHTGQQDTTDEAPCQRQVILNRNSLHVTSNIPRFRRETIQHNLTNNPRQTGPT